MNLGLPRSAIPRPAIRPAAADDRPFMAAMLAEAADWREPVARPGDAALADPNLALYLPPGWPRSGEVGLIADVDGQAVGACWWICLTADNPGYGFVDEAVPELVIGVAPAVSGRGIGERLLAGLVETADAANRPGLSLSVEVENRAIGLYRKAGFLVERLDRQAVTMIRRRPTPPGLSSEAPTLTVVCGLPGVGKTTLARALARSSGAERFGPDDWMAALDFNLWEADVRTVVEALQWDRALDELRMGRSVIIEWGTWARSERDALCREATALGARCELHYLKAEPGVLLDRISRRDRERPPITADDMARWAEVFEPPTSEEAGGWNTYLEVDTGAGQAADGRG